MTINSIAKELAKREGLKKQTDIAQIKEMLGHLSDMIYENYKDLHPDIDVEATAYIDVVLYNNGVKRAKKKERAASGKKNK